VLAATVLFILSFSVLNDLNVDKLCQLKRITITGWGKEELCK